MSTLELKIPPLLLVLIFGILMWFFSLYTQVSLFSKNLHLSLAIIFLILGLAFIVAGVISFKRHNTTVNPTTPEATSTLVTSGVYRFSRNPMYVGFLLLLLSWGLYLSSIVVFVIPVVFVLYMNQFQIKSEEKILDTIFGNEFDKYKSHVRRWL